MESSNPSRSELPQLVTHHLFRESEGEEGSAVVDLNLEAHQLGKNHRPTGPESDFLEEATFLGVLLSDDLLPSTEESRSDIMTYSRRYRDEILRRRSSP